MQAAAEEDAKSAAQTATLDSAHGKVMSQLKDGDKELQNTPTVPLYHCPPLCI